jgi:putative copper resistance protein D
VINPWLIAARAAHFAACLLMFGLCVFDRFIARGRDWRSTSRPLMLFALPVALLSGTAWFALVTIDMSGSLDAWRLVGTQTNFGHVWQLRLCFWLAFCFAAFFSRWAALILSGLLLGSLAWAGHGQVGQPPALHLAADAIHLLTAGCWPTGLLPFAMLLAKIRRTDPGAIVILTRRFSALSLISVALLTATGLMNSFFLVGSLHNLFWTTYGRVLMVKLVLFALTVSIGGMNLLLLKPRLPAASAKLRGNVWLEVALAMLIVCAVAVLGLLPPARQ